MKKSKRYKDNFEQIDRLKDYSLKDAVTILLKCNKATFDETVELAMELGVDPRHADQIVRGTVVLPNGTGKKVRVLVFAKGPQLEIAEKNGADYAGGDDLVEKIKGGWLDFDAVVATPDMMGTVGKIGKILGPRNLMPNPKVGTVTQDVEKAINEIKSGKVEFRVNKSGAILNGVAKISFDSDKIMQNVKAFIAAIVKAKPAAAKGTYLRKISISSTMGPGLKLDKTEFLK